MNYKNMCRVKEKIIEVSEKHKAIVVTTGTDSMALLGFFLRLTLPTDVLLNKQIILTGSMLPGILLDPNKSNNKEEILAQIAKVVGAEEANKFDKIDVLLEYNNKETRRKPERSGTALLVKQAAKQQGETSGLGVEEEERTEAEKKKQVKIEGTTHPTGYYAEEEPEGLEDAKSGLSSDSGFLSTDEEAEAKTPFTDRLPQTIKKFFQHQTESDALVNIKGALALAASNQLKGRIVVVMNGRIFGPPYVAKHNTSATDAFRATTSKGHLGTTKDSVEIHYMPSVPKVRFNIDGVNELPSVPTVRCDAVSNLDAIRHIDNHFSNNIQAIILLGNGNGNIPNDVLNTVKKWTDQGKICIRTTNASDGEVTRNDAVDDKLYGTICSGNLRNTTAALLAKLMLAGKGEVVVQPGEEARAEERKRVLNKVDIKAKWNYVFTEYQDTSKKIRRDTTKKNTPAGKGGPRR